MDQDGPGRPESRPGQTAGVATHSGTMNTALKPQDLASLLAVGVHPAGDWSYQTLSTWMGVSPSYLFYALQRAAASGLYSGESRRLNLPGVLEFIEHGVRWCFYVQLRGRVRGVPTAHTAPSLSKELLSDPMSAVVWPSSSGRVSGQALDPLYPQAVSTVADAPRAL